MTTSLRKAICGSALALFFGFLQEVQAAPLHVMLDPGHGGADAGASRGALKESVIALKVAQQVSELLKKDARFKVSMTRVTDRKVSLSRRTRLAEDFKADLFVSIHLNSSPDPRVRGTEIYFQNQLPADEEALFLVGREHEHESADEAEEGSSKTPSKSEPLSTRTDLKRILEDLDRNHRIQTSSELGKTLLGAWLEAQLGHKAGTRSIRQAPFHVVSNINIPSVLVELGYVSNPQEGARLASADHQKELARALYEGLVKFKETVDNDQAENLKSQSLAVPQK